MKKGFFALVVFSLMAGASSAQKETAKPAGTTQAEGKNGALQPANQQASKQRAAKQKNTNTNRAGGTTTHIDSMSTRKAVY